LVPFYVVRRNGSSRAKQWLGGEHEPGEVVTVAGQDALLEGPPAGEIEVAAECIPIRAMIDSMYRD